MNRPGFAFIGVLTVGLAACGGRMVGGGGDGGGGGTDAGPAVMDSGPTPTVDAGMLDGGATQMNEDAGPPDAGPPPCACPALPAACAPPAVNQPTFTPETDAMLVQLLDVIACADTTLEIAVYQGNWDCLSNAISTQLSRDPDLTVTVIVDNEDCPRGECFAERIAPMDRVTVVRDTRVGNLMHHKVVVADGARAWIGSANFTQNSFCGDHNNAIVVEQPEIVARLQTELARMAGGDFSSLSMADGAPTVAAPYTLYFSPVSPQSDPAVWFDAMRAAIGSATTSVEVMTNAWTRSELANDLAALPPEVNVRVLVSSNWDHELPAQILAMEGIDIRQGRFHDKVMIIDGHLVITGSANWSMNAWSNNENQIWIDDPTVAAAYQADFERVFPSAAVVEYTP